MKTKRTFYFLLIILGAVFMAIGGNWVRKEYALATGIVLLMFGIYKSSGIWQPSGEDHEKEQDA